jgi:uncharacterized damage-inducible protein DinB
VADAERRSKESLMHPRTEELLSVLDTHRDSLRAAVDAIPADRRDQRPATDRWSVAEVLEHLAIVEKRIARVVASTVAQARESGLRAESDTTSVLPMLPFERLTDRTQVRVAPTGVAPRGVLTAEAAWQELTATRAALSEAVRAADGLALGDLKVPHPALGEANLYQWVLFVAGHEARHTAQIRELGQAPIGGDA